MQSPDYLVEIHSNSKQLSKANPEYSDYISKHYSFTVVCSRILYEYGSRRRVPLNPKYRFAEVWAAHKSMHTAPTDVCGLPPLSKHTLGLPVT